MFKACNSKIQELGKKFCGHSENSEQIKNSIISIYLVKLDKTEWSELPMALQISFWNYINTIYYTNTTTFWDYYTLK